LTLLLPSFVAFPATPDLECGDLEPLSLIRQYQSGDKSPHSKIKFTANLRFEGAAGFGPLAAILL
jgi:hypothetical protein